MTSSSSPGLSFAGFLEYFPSVELPLILGEETHREFSQINDPLPLRAIEQYLLPLNEVEDDEEITEYIPCFQISDAGDFRLIVYWKAGLLSYEYHLASFTPSGELIEHKVIAGTFYQDGVLSQSVATISEAHIIYIASGQAQLQSEQDDTSTYEAASSTTTLLRFTDKGMLEEIHSII